MKPLPDEIRCYLAFTDFRRFIDAPAGENVWLEYMHCRKLDRQIDQDIQSYVHYYTTYIFTHATEVPGIQAPYPMEELLLMLCRDVADYVYDPEWDDWREKP